MSNNSNHQHKAKITYDTFENNGYNKKINEVKF